MNRFLNPFFSILLGSFCCLGISMQALAQEKCMDLFVVKNIAGCFIEAANLFDTNYSDLLGAQMPGRWIMAGINLTF